MKAEEALQLAKAYTRKYGGGTGTGVDGGYYIPSVDAAGNLTFTASKEGMPAVEGQNIKGEAGDKGDKGDKGDPGEQGEEGKTGKSAYEYAKEGGYTGSEDDFKAKMAADAVSVSYDESTKTLNICSARGG